MGRIKRTKGRFQFLWAILKKFYSDYGLFLSSGITSNLWVYYSSAILIMGGAFAFILEERRGEE